ncbi:hypothetical protein B566_EDAN014587 [Ephemera danica]|nr:hypothetical protein B566_EDAN014587 [Ephemera danica]
MLFLCRDDALTAGLSALYAKLLFVLGMAFPVAEVISDKVPKSFDQGLYLYLHIVSLAFMIYMYATLMRDKSVYSVVNSYNVDVEGDNPQPVYVRNRHRDVPMIRYGSFYLRAGAIAFGIGSMIYSGLEFGQYFELEEDSDCQNVLLAVTPAMRMVLTIMQIQFLFLNNRFEMGKYRLVARFGLMHMLATNMCEWMYVLVEEAKHEIMHLTHHPLVGHTRVSHGNHTDDDHHERVDRAAHTQNCMRTNIMGSLVQNASPFLFPCTIEYSLICAVILYEMWKNVNTMIASKRHHSKKNNTSAEDDKALLNGYKLAAGKLIDPSINHHHFSVDCASAHRGLFSGIIILVLTIISLIMFFVLIRDPLFSRMAVFEVNVCEIIMYIASTVAVIVCMKQMRELDYKRGKHGFELDGILIVVAQTGMYVYCLFSIIGSYFSETDNAPGGLLVELCSLIQTTCQTIFILDACWRRCSNVFQVRRKPGRQLVTFLLVANLAMWTINALEKNRAEFHPTHLEFYGVWAWTIITHVSMPLAVFYRFHSTVCLLEIWKTAYKLKHETSH